MAMEVDFQALDKWAKRMRVDTTRLMNRSFGRAAYGLKRQLQKVMRVGGGVNGVPRFKPYEDFTIILKRGSMGPIGGVLAEKSRIVAFKRGGWQIVGWPDKLMEWSELFQEGRGGQKEESYFTDPEGRAMMHRRAKSSYVPNQYVHNPRQVIRPYFERHVEENLIQWAKGAYYKELARKMKQEAR